jgi:hypothetical protein
VYARLLAACDEKGRAELERELYAPLEGWDAAERNLWAAIDAAPDPDDEQQ